MEGQYQFFSLNKRIDWENGRYWNVQATDAGLSLNQFEKHVFDKRVRLQELTIQSSIVSFTLGKNGVLFLLDQQTNLWKYDVETDYVERLFPAGHGLFTAQALLTCSGDTLYIADPNGAYMLSAFSISNGQILWSSPDWNGKLMVPLSMAVGEKGFVYLLLQDHQRGDHPNDFQIVRTNPTGDIEWLVEYGREESSDSEGFLRSETNRNLGEDLEVGPNRFDLQVMKTGEILVLNRFARELLRFDQQGTLSTCFSVLQPQQCSGITVDSKDHIYIGDQRQLAINEEDNRFLIRFNPNGQFDTRISAYRGRADKVQVDDKDRIYVWNEPEQSITILSLKPRTMELERTGQLKGVYFSQALDSGSPEMVWHKLLVEADIPEETQLRISYFASDRKSFLFQGKQMDIDDFIIEKSYSLDQISDVLTEFWSEPIVNPKDALLFKAKGRFVWLKIELMGSEQYTPSLYKMRVYYPRMSLLSYLPAVYQEDEKSRDFLERFLSLFGTFLFDMEEQIDQTPSHFDADVATGPFLKWLASWLGLQIDDSWEEGQIKELISAAPELYRLRGTRWAMERILEIYTGAKPIIIEHFQYKHMQEMSELRELIERLYGDHPYQFSVLIKAKYVRTEKQRMMLEKVLNEQKPAFTEARLIILEPWIYMDMHTYLGLNTYLSEPSLMRLDYQSTMPNDTILIDMDQENRIGVHTRLALDAQLE